MAQEEQDRGPIVAVPVRDEAERLPALIEALERQTWISQPGKSCPSFLFSTIATTIPRES